ncbi:MAG: tetratricopeptide repeat protein [Sandaracinaceae bacterium]
MSVPRPPPSAVIDVDEPTVLLVAEGERLAPALAARLGGRGLIVETASLEDAVSAAFVGAPDLIVLAGAAARDGGLRLLAELAAQPVTSTLPVVLVADPEEERPTSSSFRFGVVGVVDRTASADAMARHIENIVRGLPEHDGEASGLLGEATIEEVVALFAESLRSGVLSVGGPSGPAEQIVVRADRPVQEAIAELVERIRPLIADVKGGALRYEFHESPSVRLSSFDVLDEGEEGAAHELVGRRVLLIERNPARSDLLTQALRAEGALVAVVDGAGSGLDLARDLMPEVVLIDGRGVEGWAREAMRAIRHDPWLRWASLLVVDEGRLWANPRRPDLTMLAPRILSLTAADRDVASRASSRPTMMARLDLIGPIRLLRALTETGLGLRLSVQHPRARVEVDLADGLVVGATARIPGEREVVEGPSALATLVGLGSGRAQITHEDAPRTANVMAAPDDALAAAAGERPVVAPSIPPPSLPPPPRAAGSDAEAESDAVGSLPNMVRKLEVLLDALTRATPGAIPPPPSTPNLEPEPPPPEEHEIDALYEPRLVDRLRKRAQQTASVAPPAVVVPPPKARIPKPGRLPPPRAAIPKPGTAPPPRPSSSAPTTAPPPAEAVEDGPASRRRRQVRAGSRTLVLGSVQADGPPPSPTEPPAPPIESAPDASAVTERPPEPGALLEPLVDPPLPVDAHEELAEIEASYDPPLPPPGPVVAHDPFLPSPAPIETAPAPAAEIVVPEPEPSFGPPASAMPSPELLGAPEIPGERRSVAVWVVAGLGLVALLGALAVGAVVLWPSDPPPPVAVTEPTDLEPSVTAAPEPSTEPSLPTPEAPVDDVPMPSVAPAPRDGPPAPTPEGHEPPAAPAADPSEAPAEHAPEDAPPTRVAATVSIPVGAPVEGSDDDYDLAALGIHQVAPPGSRRSARRLHERMIQHANRLRRAHDLDEAEAAYRELLGTFPESTRGTAGLARVYLDREQPAGAVVYAQRLVRLSPTVANNWVFLGDVLRDSGDRDAARRAYERALEVDPRFTRPRERLAEL